MSARVKCAACWREPWMRCQKLSRIVFVLREIEQMSVEETARHLDLKPQTVKTRLHRARRLLRSELEKQFGSALQEAYAFDGWRCERLTNTVLRRLKMRM